MQVSAIEGYRLWAETFDSAPNPLLALETRSLAPWLSAVRGKRVLDICCGTGRWLKWTRAHGARAAGCDASHEMLRHAGSGVAQGDALRLPFASGIADVVLCTLALGYLSPARSALQEMRRIARPGGLVMVTDMHPDAIRAGWRRSFHRDGAVYDIENYAHSLEELEVPGLALEEHRSAGFGEPERPIFEAAGKSSAFFEQACELPALWMLRWRAH
jgi:SAM-dependent methyltransferase